MKLLAPKNSIIVADIIIVKQHAIELPSYNELFSQFSYIIDYDIDKRLPFYDDMKRAKFIHRIPWMGELFPVEYESADFIDDSIYLSKDDYTIYSDERIKILPGGYVRKLEPSFLISIFKDIDEVVEYLNRYFVALAKKEQSDE